MINRLQGCVREPEPKCYEAGFCHKPASPPAASYFTCIAAIERGCEQRAAKPPSAGLICCRLPPAAGCCRLLLSHALVMVLSPHIRSALPACRRVRTLRVDNNSVQPSARFDRAGGCWFVGATLTNVVGAAVGSAEAAFIANKALFLLISLVFEGHHGPHAGSSTCAAGSAFWSRRSGSGDAHSAGGVLSCGCSVL